MASVDQRLTSVEVEVKNLKGMVQNIMTNQSKDHDLLTGVSAQIKTFCSGLKDVKDDAKEASRANWGRVWAVILVVITAVIAAIGTTLLNSKTGKAEVKSPQEREEKEKNDALPQDPVDRR